MNWILLGVLAAVVVIAAVLGLRVFGQRFRCPFCREWLPRGAAYQIGRTAAGGPYVCPFCNHVIRKRDLQVSAK